jgi:hypothetical protein
MMREITKKSYNKSFKKKMKKNTFTIQTNNKKPNHTIWKAQFQEIEVVEE